MQLKSPIVGRDYWFEIGVIMAIFLEVSFFSFLSDIPVLFGLFVLSYYFLQHIGLRYGSTLGYSYLSGWIWVWALEIPNRRMRRQIEVYLALAGGVHS